MKPRINEPARLEPDDTILMIQLGHIGDLVVSLPVVQALKENAPGGRLILAVREVAREIVEDCPWVDGIISVDKKKRSPWEQIRYQRNFFKELRHYRFDYAVDIRPGSRGSFLAWMSRAPIRAGHFDPRPKRNWMNRMFTHLLQPGEWDGIYAGEQNLRVVEPLGLRIQDRVPTLNVAPSKLEKVRNLLADEGVPLEKPLIAFHPFCRRKLKEWPMDSWVLLAERIHEKHDCALLMTCAPEDRPSAKQLMEKCGVPVHDLAGKTSLGELPALLQACSLLISIDTAAVHIAAAAGTPTFTFFGPSDPAVWSPPGDGHGCVSTHRPCKSNACTEEPCDPKESGLCLQQLTVEESWLVVDRQIAGIVHSFEA